MDFTKTIMSSKFLSLTCIKKYNCHMELNLEKVNSIRDEPFSDENDDGASMKDLDNSKKSVIVMGSSAKSFVTATAQFFGISAEKK